MMWMDIAPSCGMMGAYDTPSSLVVAGSDFGSGLLLYSTPVDNSVRGVSVAAMLIHLHSPFMWCRTPE